MTTPISPEALQNLLKTLPPEHPDPFLHLSALSASQLLLRRIELSQAIKASEAERSAIDEALSAIYGTSELRYGVAAPGGWILRQRTRTSWSYSEPVKSLIRTIQKEAQESGEATELRTTYLVLNQEQT